jgi:type IV secretion system protein VirD4
MARRRSRWLRRSFLLGLLLLFVGSRVHGTAALRLLGLGAVLVAVPAVVWWRRWSGSIGSVRWWSARSRWNHGLASRWQILWKASRFAMRRRMCTLRPSYRELSWWARLRVPTSEFASKLCKVGWLWVWASCEDVTQTLGRPRWGKSVAEICRIIDAPGAVIATSTRADLYEKAHRLRRQHGPVFVFNPSGLGGIATTVSFDPLTGCTDPKTAVDRAGDLIAGAAAGSEGGSTVGDREHWAGQARDTLAVLMHAAALGGASMRDVHAWVSNPKAHYNRVREMLETSPEAAGFGHELEHFVHTNDRTQTSITQSIRPALMWLHDAGAARAAGQQVTGPVIDAAGVTVPDGPPPPPLDVEALLFGHGTVYLLGAEDAQHAPLLTALTGHLARTGRQIAGRSPDGRLDPPATFALDEAPNICMIPLDKWSSDFGGRGMPMHILAQSSSQLAQRWGEHGAATIMNNAGAVIIYGATSDKDLRTHSTLIGDREERVITRDHRGKVISETTHRVPIFSPAQLAQLPKFRAVVLCAGMPPVIGKTERYWKRADYRALQRADRRDKRAKAWARRGAVAQRLGRDLADAVQEMAAEVADLWAQWQRTHRNRTTESVSAVRTDDTAGGESDA